MGRKWRWVIQSGTNLLFDYSRRHTYSERVRFCAAAKYIEDHGPEDAERLSADIWHLLLPGDEQAHHLYFFAEAEPRHLVPLFCAPSSRDDDLGDLLNIAEKALQKFRETTELPRDLGT